MSERESHTFRRAEQVQPPPARRITDAAVMRFDGVYEVDPRLMEQVPQQPFPNWDTLRIVHSREAHLAWMHRHFAGTVISGERILKEMESNGDTSPA